MKVLRFLRRRRPQHPNWRTAQRICAIVGAFLREDGEEHTVKEISRFTGMSIVDLYVVLSWMERLGLAHSYFPEPVIPGQPLRRLYLLTPQAYKWVADAVKHGQTPKAPPLGDTSV